MLFANRYSSTFWTEVRGSFFRTGALSAISCSVRFCSYRVFSSVSGGCPACCASCCCVSCACWFCVAWFELSGATLRSPCPGKCVLLTVIPCHTCLQTSMVIQHGVCFCIYLYLYTHLSRTLDCSGPFSVTLPRLRNPSRG